MYLKWGMLPDLGWSLILLIPIFLLSLWLARTVSKRIIWLLPALVLYAFVGWDFFEPFKVLFKAFFWIAVLVVIVTAVLTAFGRWDRTRVSRLPLAMMVAMLGILFVSGIIGYVLGTQADELRHLHWNGLMILAVIFFTAGVVLFFLARMIGVIVLAVAIVLFMAGLMGSSLQTEDQEPIGRPAGPEDVCLTVDGMNDRETIQTVLPPGWSYVNGSKRDCISPEEPEPPVPTEEPEVVPPTDTCPSRFIQDLDPNFRNRGVSKGFEGLVGEKRRQTLEAMRHDYRYLDAVGDFVFDRDYDASTLYATYEGTLCLSKAGRNLYQQVKGALMAVDVVSGLAPKDGYNSWFKNGRLIIKDRPGVKGDRRATIYMLPDGRKLILLDSCGNLVFSGTHRE